MKPPRPEAVALPQDLRGESPARGDGLSAVHEASEAGLLRERKDRPCACTIPYAPLRNDARVGPYDTYAALPSVRPGTHIEGAWHEFCPPPRMSALLTVLSNSLTVIPVACGHSMNREAALQRRGRSAISASSAVK